MSNNQDRIFEQYLFDAFSQKNDHIADINKICSEAKSRVWSRIQFTLHKEREEGLSMPSRYLQTKISFIASFLLLVLILGGVYGGKVSVDLRMSNAIETLDKEIAMLTIMDNNTFPLIDADLRTLRTLNGGL